MQMPNMLYISVLNELNFVALAVLFVALISSSIALFMATCHIRNSFITFKKT